MAEEHSLVFALKETMRTRHESEAETAYFMNTLRELFPQAMGEQANSEYSSLNQPVVSAVTEVFKEDLMESNELMFTKVRSNIRLLAFNNKIFRPSTPLSHLLPHFSV